MCVQHVTLRGGGDVLLGGAGCKEAPKASAPLSSPPPSPAPLTVSHKSFTDPEWATLTAAVDRILPRDEDPGALDAKVPDYIDSMLQTEALQQMRASFVPGVAALERRAQRMFQLPFASCSPLQKDERSRLRARKERGSAGTKCWWCWCWKASLGDPSYEATRPGWLKPSASI